MNLFGRGRLPDGAVLRQARDALAPHHPALLDRLERLLDPLLRCALPHDPVAPDADPPHQTARIAAAALWPGRIPEALSQALARIGDASLEGVNAPIRSLPNARHTHFVEVDTTLHRAWHSDCSLTESASLFLTESIFVRSRLVHHGSHAYLESNTFIACTLTGSGWRVATWLRCQLNDCVLAGDFRDALFHLCSFDGVDMSEANLTGASLRLCDTAGNAFDDDWAQRSERNAGLRGLAGPDHLRSAAVANAAAAPEALAELEAWLDAHDDWSDEPGHAFALEDGRFVHAFTPEAVPRVAARWLAARPR
jgi:hypothetical protein